MKRGSFWVVTTFLMMTLLVLTSCTKTATSSSTTAIANNSTTNTTITTSITTIKTTSPTSTSITTASTAGNWWDSLGKPQYGGTITLRIYQNIVGFDPYYPETLFTINSAWADRLFANDWTVDPAVFSYKIQFRSSDFVKGQLALSWEFSDPSTFVVHLRQGVHWQNIAPANGREFTAADVAFHYNRIYGVGGGFTKPSPEAVTNGQAYQTLISVTATDKYTVVFKWGTPNPEFILETQMQVSNSVNCLENSDAVTQWGDVNDWHHAIGTGPFILSDFVSGSSATLVKNPNYYGYDERYPQNHLPYVDELKILVIPDNATALAGLRTGKIDVQDGVTFQDVQSVQKTNPEILVATNPSINCVTISPRVDIAPFTDIKVREAMQLALDLPTIAKTYYNGHALATPCTLTSYYLTGWGFPYDQWPQDLKDQYAYNPTAAKKLLADAGFPNGFKTTLIADTASDVNLMQVVKSYFLSIGIDMDIQTMDSATFATYVQGSHKNQALAIRSAGNLGLTYEPITQLNRLHTGASSNFGMINDPVNDAFYAKALAANSVADVKQILTDANKYVTQQHFVISLLQYDNFALYQPWLKGYNGQLYGAGLINPSGLPMLSFYQARYWIDQNLKKSMGH
jgi:peptide/nickel transport system substrate-binding protein